MHEACEVWNYYGCAQQETNPRIKAIWERFLDYELGHFALAKETFERIEKRDAMELMPAEMPDPIPYEEQRQFVRKVLAQEVDLRAFGTQYVPKEEEGRASRDYREQVNAEGSPSQSVSAGYRWAPGTELTRKVVNF
jgi:hypothetical protein